MELITSIKLITLLLGGGVVLGESLGLYFKAKRESLLAKGKLKGKEHLEDIIGNTGLKLSKNVQLKAKFDYEGIIVCGATGSGKTTGVFYPNLLSNDIKGSLIVTDPKGELFKDTSEYQSKVCGRKVYKLDLNNVDNSHRYNLLESCKDNQEVLQLANSILTNGALSVELQTGKKIGGMEWIQMSEPLLAATLLYCKGLSRPYNNIEFALQLIINLSTEQLDKLFSNCNNIDVITQFNIFKVVGGADRTEGSIKVTLATNMKIFTDKKVNKIGYKTNIDIDKFRTEPSILYISYAERKSPYYAPFIAPLFSQIIDHLLDNFEKGKTLPIHFLFDEFGNIGAINNMRINASTVRSREVSLVTCVQSFSQLYQIYGRDNARDIINNLKTKVILAGLNDIDTLDYLTKICGDTQIKNYSISTNSKGDSSKSESNLKRKIFEDGEIRTLETDKALIISDNKQPILDTKIRHYTDKQYLENISDRQVKIDKDYSRANDITTELERIKREVAAMEELEDIEDYEEGLHFRES